MHGHMSCSLSAGQNAAYCLCTIHRQLTCRTKCSLLSVHNTQAVDLQDKMQPTVCTIHRQLTCRTKCGLLSVYNTQAVDLQDKMQPTVCTIHRQLTCRTEGQLLMSAGGFLVFKCQVVTNSVAQVKSAQASNSLTRFYSHQLQLSPYLLLSLHVFYCMLC